MTLLTFVGLMVNSSSCKQVTNNTIWLPFQVNMHIYVFLKSTASFPSKRLFIFLIIKQDRRQLCARNNSNCKCTKLWNLGQFFFVQTFCEYRLHTVRKIYSIQDFLHIHHVPNILKSDAIGTLNSSSRWHKEVLAKEEWEDQQEENMVGQIFSL